MSTFTFLFAQASSAVGEATTSGGRGFNWFLIFNPAVVWVFIPIVAIVVGTIAKVIQKSQEHRERMAMIAAGLHPDYPPDELLPPDDANAGMQGNLRETTAHVS